jgi:hypothetical protein
MGNLVAGLNIQPSEAKAMEYHELQYWNSWHEANQKALNDAVNKAKKGTENA